MTHQRTPGTVVVTLWGGPLDGLQVRLNPAITHFEHRDRLGRAVTYALRGTRYEYLPPRQEQQ